MKAVFKSHLVSARLESLETGGITVLLARYVLCIVKYPRNHFKRQIECVYRQISL